MEFRLTCRTLECNVISSAWPFDVSKIYNSISTVAGFSEFACCQRRHLGRRLG